MSDWSEELKTACSKLRDAYRIIHYLEAQLRAEGEHTAAGQARIEELEAELKTLRPKEDEKWPKW